jgi:polar amino acid transport system permease protein
MSRHFGFSEFVILLLALRWTVLLTLIAFVGGGIGGAIVALLRVSPLRIIRIGAAIFIKMLQGLPLLILLFLVFFGANILGARINAWAAAAIGYTLYGSAFLGEIWRGCIQAIPSGQWDAATALGLRFSQRLRLVVAPQAARIAIAPSVGFLVQLLKSTSLASVIGFSELTLTAQQINNVTFQPFVVFGLVALLYFALCWPLSLLSLQLERRYRLGTP